MTHDPLQSLLRLRRLAADQARSGLAESLRAETEAEAAVTAIETEIAEEAEVAADLTSGDADVEAFGAWLRSVRPKQHAAQAAEVAAEAETAEARAVLAMSRAAVRAVEEILSRHAADERQRSERRTQHELDEVGRRLGKTRQP